MEKQREVAKQAMIDWLKEDEDFKKAPAKIECVDEFDLYDLHYYVFKFKKGLFGDWLVGVCGGYEANELEHCGHVYSNMDKYDSTTALSQCKEMVAAIREYWMNQAKQAKMQECFEANLKYISQTEINVEAIEKQFVKNANHYYLTVGEVDCPTGKIIVSDSLCFLVANKYAPVLEQTIPTGKYPVIVSIYRNELVGIRMCSAKLKIKDSKAINYQLASPTVSTAVAKSKDGLMSGFPVDAGMMSFCDEQVANEYRNFIDQWYQQHPDGNHYDDYFAKLFADSYQALPAYQRDGGDFIEWANPLTENKMVMVASGFGDGFYQSYWGYDETNEICELIVPMVNPDLFE